VLPTSRKVREKWGTRFFGRACEIKSWGHAASVKSRFLTRALRVFGMTRFNEIVREEKGFVVSRLRRVAALPMTSLIENPGGRRDVHPVEADG